jgi:hypothetical protein
MAMKRDRMMAHIDHVDVQPHLSADPDANVITTRARSAPSTEANSWNTMGDARQPSSIANSRVIPASA